MADENLRELERIWRQTGADDDWARLLAAAHRIGKRERLRVELLAGEPRFMETFVRRAPARVRKALELAIPTESLRYLLVLDDGDLLSRRHFGPKSLLQLQVMLADYDLRLGMSQDEASAVLGPHVLTAEQQVNRLELMTCVVAAAARKLHGDLQGIMANSWTCLQDLLCDQQLRLFATGRRLALRNYGLFLPMTPNDAHAYMIKAGPIPFVSRALYVDGESE